MAEIDLRNRFDVVSGQNMPNHTMSMKGRGKYVQVGSGTAPAFRTREEVYCFIAHLLKHTDAIDLPSEAPDDEEPMALDEFITVICETD